MRPHHRRRQQRADQQQQQQQQRDQISTQTFKIITQYGDMLVVRQGVQQQQQHHHHHHHHSHHHPATTSGSTAQTTGTGSDQQQQQQPTTRPIIMTFHDLGLNSELQFANFCDSDEVKLMLQTFTLIHVNFIGQEFQVGGQLADSLPDDYKYPTVEQMAECVVDVCAQLRVRSFVALAVGAGAHIVGSLALLRPDLVHGLFLINPVISSCSITEWLCFKMSAIASNHQLIGSHGGGGGHGHGPDAGDASPGGSSSRHSSFRSGATDDSEHPHQQQHHSGGLRKLWNAVHHHHHHATGSGGNKSPELNNTEEAASESTAAAAPREKPASNRLRQLILSRNFRLGAAAKQAEGGDKQVPVASHRRRPSITNSIDTQLDSLQKQSKSKADATSGPEGTRRRFSGGTGSDSSTPSSPTGRSSKRPPIEYLMYHHFGSASFQRVRRPSLQAANDVEPAGSSTKRSSCDSSGSGQSAQALQQHRDSRGSTDDEASHGPHRAGVAGSASDSPAHRSQQQQQRRQIARSLSICLSPQHLASISSDRRRANYMQTIYKQYFTQINAHNLWLFAQSFVKRRSLNLRKDCGAAAHAAAAAAALSTSICAAFVGMAPAPAGSSAAQDASRRAGPESTAGEQQSSGASAPAGSLAAAVASQQQNHASSTSAPSNQQQQQALVAGTKVKRTFTCQTLIMCSSVQIHCERALKLMALLNPLQATWIKTDQLLVLEERPEKVCQALRLFLQGLGYSMSTYERRLRLSSAQASFSSADSNGSARSLSDVAAAATTTSARS